MIIQCWVVCIYKWLVLIVGIQIIFWIVGGFGMVVLDIEKVCGEYLVVLQVVSVLDMVELISFVEVLVGFGVEQVYIVILFSWMGQFVYYVEFLVGVILMVDVCNGMLLLFIDEEIVCCVVLVDYIVELEIVLVEFFVDLFCEYGWLGLVWQVNFEDGEGMWIYVLLVMG